MALSLMSPGGKWMRPPHDAPPVYVPEKQAGGHFKRLVEEGWMPIEDPRKDDGTPTVRQTPAQEAASREAAMQAQIDQLKALVQQLVAGKQEQSDGSSIDNEPIDQQDAADDRRSVKRKPAV